VVLLDGSDPVGPAEGLFNRDFFEGVERVLRPGGVFALQSESPVLMPELFADINNTLRDVFDRADPYLGPVPIYGAGLWSWTYCSDEVDPQAVDAARLEAATGRSKYYNGDIHRYSFVLPTHLQRALGR
jgi:spermidine synthase